MAGRETVAAATGSKDFEAHPPMSNSSAKPVEAVQPRERRMQVIEITPSSTSFSIETGIRCIDLGQRAALDPDQCRHDPAKRIWASAADRAVETRSLVMLLVTPVAQAIAKKLPISTQAGATAIEYGLIAALVALAAVTALTTLGTDLAALFGAISTKITGVTPS
jgi:pilus assembly protein Flp/PilA